MRPSHQMHRVYPLALLATLVIAGCLPKSNPVIEDVAPMVEVESIVAEQPEMEYAAGDAAYPEGYSIHTVSIPEENISIIARWYTDEQKNWLVLVKCNPTIKPNRIFLGDKIKIPRSIMTRQTPLTAEFVKQSRPEPHQKRKKKISQSKNKIPVKPVVEEDPLLFGPKAY